MDKIRGYKITGEISATSGKLYFASRWGKRYVLKEFLRYRFPADEGEACPPMLSHVEKRTQAFMDRLTHTTQYIRKHIREDGLLNIPLEIFRQGKMIYKVSRQIDSCGIETQDLHNVLTPAQMNVLFKSILLQLSWLGRIGFIHGDVKPENVVISRKDRVFTGSIIDFDTGYIAKEGPGESVEYTPEYASPEMLLMEALMEAPEDDGDRKQAVSRVTPASDVYAMACVFCHMLTGSAWMMEDQGGDLVPPGRQVLMGGSAQLPPLHHVWRALLQRMLAADPARRLSPGEVTECLNACMGGGLYEELTDPWARLKAYRPPEDEAELPGSSRIRLMEDPRRKRRALVAFMEDCWQTPMLFMNRSRAAHALQDEHQRNLTELKHLAARLSGMQSLSGAVSPFSIVRQHHSVFTVQYLPRGVLTGLERLHGMAKAAEIDAAMVKLLRDIHACHQAGMIHGTIAMDSVYAVKWNDELSLVLADPFSLRMLEKLPHGSRIDADARLLAPEMNKYITAADDEASAALRELIGCHTDVFSLGLMYHLMLTGELPEMTDESCTCLSMAAEMGEIRLSSRLNEGRAEIIRRMIAFEPDERPASCGEAADMIERMAEGWTKASEQAAQKPTRRRPRVSEDSRPEPVQGAKPAPVPVRRERRRPKVTADDVRLPEPRHEAKPAAKEAAAPAGLFEQALPDAFLDDDDESLWEAADVHETEAAGPADLIDAYDVQNFEQADNAFLKNPAKHIGSGKKVLLRQLRADADDVADAPERFDWLIRRWNRAAEAGGMLQVRDVRDHMGVLHAVTDTALGDHPADLNDIKETGAAVLQWVIPIVLQLQAVHEAGLRMSLISPRELVFLGGGEDRQACLFGVDHIREAGSDGDLNRWAELMRLSCTPEGCGDGTGDRTEAYMAPETQELVFGGAKRELTQAADIFSLGALMYRMMCGTLPFTDAAGWNDAYRKGRVQLSEKLPFTLRWLIGTMLAKDPESRPQSCDDVLTLMQAIREQHDKVHTVTVRRNGMLAGNEPVRLYALADDGQELYAGTATTNASGRAEFTGFLPAGYTYEVRGTDIRQICRWRFG